MLALMKKDLRVFRTVTVGGIVLITLAHLISFGFPPIFGTLITVVLAAAYGGSSFATERREHSADWLNVLPVTRPQIITSKILTSFTCLIFLLCYAWLPAAVLRILDLRMLYRMTVIDAIGFFASTLGSCGILFGLAWLLSTFLESAAIAACIAIAFVFMVFVGAQGLQFVLRYYHSDAVMVGMIVFLALASIASFVLGTRYYLNRVEP